MGRPYYSRIARAWLEATGSRGGPLKRYALNGVLIERVGSLDHQSLLEVGAGTGYFARLLVRSRDGEVPERLVVTDQSGAMLRIAEREFPVSNAEYHVLDVRRAFPYAEDSFDLVLASMVLNELDRVALANALLECRRVLRKGGRLLAAVMHPDFVDRLRAEGKLSQLGPSFWTMPGTGALRLPVVPRSVREYLEAFQAAGYSVETEEIVATAEMARERPGLRHALGRPMALVIEGRCCATAA